jgi:alpha-amylase/alpha-mannosidase (GH57 family)
MNAPLDLVFLWHMHQPDYRDHRTGEFVLPWVYLHGIKDYSDMAGHLERHPQVRAVVNFVPVLLEQIEDYIDQFASGNFRDPLLRLLAEPDLDRLGQADRDFLLQACFRSNHSTMVVPFPGYQRLHDLYLELTSDGTAALAYLSGAYYADLVTWYHLAWSGETERRTQPLLADLMSKGGAYNLTDRQALLAWIGETLRKLVPRYRALAERGQIELSCTPQTHPLAPLLLDFAVANESVPDAPLPFNSIYPGGRSRVAAQIEDARASHASRFGTAPFGMWPAEGAISSAFVQQLAMHDCRWIASGEGVLSATLKHASINDPRAAYKPWKLDSAPGLTLFFRDERLSDMIGFEYAKWHGRDAAKNFVGELEAIHAATPPGENAIVSIIMDGENAWEHYPYNGHFFFEDLYAQLEKHSQIRSSTYAELLQRDAPPRCTSLPGLTAGSWVFGSLSTWIGDPEKNRAWDLLCTAKQSYDIVIDSERLDEEERRAATAQLAICESSDWFWWFGDYNPAAAVASFDALFRRNLANLYQLLHLSPPAQLDTPICAARQETRTDHTSSGAMRRAQEPSST